MLLALTDAATAIAGMAGYPAPKLTDEQWEVYADAIHPLLAAIQQFNTMVNVPYGFEEGLPDDIINYAALLNEHKNAIGELVEYLLCRDQMFGGGYKYETMYLNEAINAIIVNSEIISGVVAKKHY